MSSDELAIHLRGVEKTFSIYDRPHHRLLESLLGTRRRTWHREFHALHGIDLDVRHGETVGLIGRNGAGKSTLLQIICGILTPTRGVVDVRGRIAALLELGAGFNAEFSGRENVFLNGTVLGLTRAQIEARFDTIAAFADIGDFIDQPLKTYSSGMVVRLAFSVAVHATPDVLIVDEALGVGDTAFQSKCLDRIRRMQHAGVAILLVSHAQNTIIEFCDRAAYLDQGRLVAVGGCREIVERYTEDVSSALGGISISARLVPQEVEAGASNAGVGLKPVPNARAEILAVTIADASGAERHTFSHGDVVRVKVDVVHHADNASPVLGIQLKSPDDIVLWTCTTKVMGLSLPPRRAGERAVYEWRLRANVGGGRYVIAVGTGDVSTGEYVPHFRRHYAGHFDVLAEPHRGQGWLEPAATFESLS